MARERSYRVELSQKEYEVIKHHAKREKSANAKMRCKIIMKADESRHPGGLTYKQVAEKCGCSETTVITTLREFCTQGVAAALSPARAQASDTANLKVTGDIEAKIIAKACSKAPAGRSRWTLSLLADNLVIMTDEGDEASLSRATIHRALVRNKIRPHLNKYWCIPPKEDAEFVSKMEDILEVYQRPYDPLHPLWCIDEKPYQILDEERKALPMRPGDIKKTDYEYKRNGTVSIFCLINPHTGKIIQSVEPTRTAIDWAEKIKYLVDELEPGAEKITLVMDNLNIHDTASLYKAFRPEEAFRIAQKLEVHYTPKHGSWLDIAEIGIYLLTRECLGRRIPSIESLRDELNAWQEVHNQDPEPINWQFTNSKARTKLKSLYPNIEEQHKKRNELRDKKS